MKYMGSKRAMLTNGLGALIDDVVEDRDRFVDLFSGSGAVAKFVATRHPVTVLASDLQSYAAVLAAAVLHRVTPACGALIWSQWTKDAHNFLAQELDIMEFASSLATPYIAEAKFGVQLSMVNTVRDACNLLPDQFPLSKAYGGHYFGMLQGVWLDALRATVPKGDLKDVAIASLVEAASMCSASPGHTAQPFAPTETGLPHLLGGWSRDIILKTQQCFHSLAGQHAKTLGEASVVDAIEQTLRLEDRDLVFVDPPYSEVQYSRFYHVLEGIAVGRVDSVSGVGRYPPLKDRPQSNFSRCSPALEEFDMLMIGIAASGAQAIVTFPQDDASNGLSGKLVEDISGQYFQVAKRAVKSTFSTLGGTGTNRNARQHATELILHLVPR